MFERFTEGARQVIVLAQEEVRILKHNYIGTEHILLGLLQENEGVAVHVLLDSRADLGDIRNDVIRMLGRSRGPSPSGASGRPGQESPDAPGGAAASFPGQLSDEELAEMIDMLRRQDRSLRNDRHSQRRARKSPPVRRPIS